MNSDNILGPELLKQNGNSPERLLEERRAKLEELLVRDRKRVTFVKRIVWTLVAIALASIVIPASLALIFFLFGKHDTYMPGVSELIVVGPMALGINMLIAAFVLGIVTLFLSRSADYRVMQVHLAEIEAILRHPTAPGPVKKE